MRRLILKMSMTVDGFVGGPNGEIDWIFKSLDEGAKAWIVDTLWQAGVHVMGSRTFHDMVAYWPTSTEVFAAPMNQIPKVVFSRSGMGGSTALDPKLTTTALQNATLLRPAESTQSASTAIPPSAGWSEARIASGELTEEIRRLKNEAGKDILAHGGARFAQGLVAHELIDEYRLLIHPVVIGGGLPLFANVRKSLNLKLVSTSMFSAGAVAHVYRPS